MSQPTLPSRGAQDGNVRVHDRRSGITRYGDVGHALAKRTKERHTAPHSKTLAGHPRVPSPHDGQLPAGNAPVAADRKHFIANAIKRPGALTAAVGGNPSKKKGKVKNLAKHGTPLERRQANFYLNVLAKARR